MLGDSGRLGAALGERSLRAVKPHLLGFLRPRAGGVGGSIGSAIIASPAAGSTALSKDRFLCSMTRFCTRSPNYGAPASGRLLTLKSIIASNLHQDSGRNGTKVDQRRRISSLPAGPAVSPSRGAARPFSDSIGAHRLGSPGC